MLERYFGVTDAVACGVCDCCIERRKQQRQGTPTSDLPTQILNLLQSEPRSIKELVASLREGDTRVLHCVEQLQEDGKISVDKRGKLIINR
jgi:ATP-dependent DNA helicase RecQ